ncbi:hypothetical protein HPB50_026974 [Hyalomma asiaticum]|uniref:Uncharacterized protein n=1 Tax=Hyalomma asiaticum TaxID=266040 RepID=A0ACB7T2Z3_HYAAI|nr:hypothetical protein HPB50_026974 [Hyalomma asiaticum]
MSRKPWADLQLTCLVVVNWLSSRVESLAQAFRESPRFGDEEAQLRVQEKLQQLRQSLAFLEASRHKVQCCLAGLDGQPRPPHPLAPHLEQRRDRQPAKGLSCCTSRNVAAQGLAQTVLKIPPWLQRRSSSAEEWDRGAADGVAEQQEEEHDEQAYANVLPSQCRALYDFQATMDDELSLCSVKSHSTEISTKHRSKWFR